MACLFACIAAVNYMQTLFDKGDMKRALQVVRDFKGASGQTIQQALQAQHAGRLQGEISWEIGIQSSFYGVMRLTATAPLKDANPQVYRFDVDLVSNGIHPADDHGRELLLEMNEPGGAGNSAAGAVVPTTAAPAPGASPSPQPPTPEENSPP
jgi:hypothetical protein